MNARWFFPWLRPVLRSIVCFGTSWFLTLTSNALAQSVTTAAIRGIVRSADGIDVDGARVSVLNVATGFIVHGEVRHGRFLIQGLEIGGPYTITVRRVGFHPEQVERVFLRLGEPVELEFTLESAAIPLDSLRVTVTAFPSVTSHGGTGTAVQDSLLHRLPTLNRDLYDFVALAPQVSTKIGFAAGGLSGGGAGFRFNSFLINGTPQRSIGGHVPPEFGGAKSVPFEAVSEYHILLAPFDVRFGDFAGALVNAVTKSGTNRLRGSVFAYGRNDALARNRADGANPAYERLQYGFSLGGPIRRDRLHFLVAGELQHFSSPASGPYVGQPTAAPEPVPVSSADIARFDDIMRGYGLSAGSGGPVENSNPLSSLFARVDLAIPRWNSRAILWVNDTHARSLEFARSARDVFALTSNTAAQVFAVRNASLQLHSELSRAGGGHNELFLSYRQSANDSDATVQQPIVNVTVPGISGGNITLISGTPQQAQGSFLRARSIHLRDDLTLPLGAAHVATLGIEVEQFHIDRAGVLGAYGTWTFASLDSLARGVAQRFEGQRDFGSAGVPMNGVHYSAYAGNQWRAGSRVAVTMGVRADLLAIDGRAPYNAAVDSIFGRRTDAMPARHLHVSPRLGFTWDLTGTGRDQLRGGVGLFTGRPPVAWLHAPLFRYGLGIGRVACGPQPSDLGPPPRFVPDYRTPPSECANGAGLSTAPRGDVDLLDRRLRMAQTLRGVLAYDRQLPWDLLGTVETMITRNVSDFVFVNLGLAGPQAVDRHGRVLYGSIEPTGVGIPKRRSGFDAGFDVIELRNTAENHAYQLSASVKKRFSDGTAGTAYYTFSRVRDVQTPLRVYTAALLNWGSRAVSGRHDNINATTSLNDVPHRFVLAGARRAPWQRWSTEFSFSYIAESGSPFTYVAWSATRGRGDLNADGSNTNDPIYVPRHAADPREIRFAPFTTPGGVHVSEAEQADAFEKFIERTACLRRQRGQILERNSCREPWTHTTNATLRQTIPFGGRALQVQLDMYNVLNLLNRDWGQYRLAAPALLEHVGQTAVPPATPQPVFRFNLNAPPWTTLRAQSSFQLQIGVRYGF